MYGPVSPDKRIPQIARYNIRAELGRGAFTRVFRATDPSRVRPVAIKVPAEEGDKELFVYLHREAAAVKALRHPNVVTIYEWGEHQGIPFIAEEYLEGETLERLIASHKRVTLLEAMRIMSQIAGALGSAQASGLVHLDLKPANLMVLADGTVKLMDFGAVPISEERAARLAEQGYLSANIRYASPEQLGSSPVVDALSDIFVYGVIYYELLTGSHPFEAAGTAGLMTKIVNEEPVPLRVLAPECPAALERLVHRALQKDPGLRYQSLDQLQREAEPILADLTRNPEPDLPDRDPVLPGLAELSAGLAAAEWSKGVFPAAGHTAVPAPGALAGSLPEPKPPSPFRLSAWKRPILAAVPLSLLLAAIGVYYWMLPGSRPAARVEAVVTEPAAVPFAPASLPEPHEIPPKPSPLAAASPSTGQAPEETAPKAVRREFDPSLLNGSRATPPPEPAAQDEQPPPVAASATEPPGAPAAVVGRIVPPPPPKEEKPTPVVPERIVQGGNFQEAKLISGPPPVVPQLAKERGLSGVVKLEITISTDGSVTNVTVLAGNPFLIPAAREAALKRRYQPAMLNGQPIEVKAPVQIVFQGPS